MSNSDFLTRLKAEAAQQAQLHDQRILPAQLDGLTSFVGKHTWQVLLSVAALSSLIIEIWKVMA